MVDNKIIQQALARYRQEAHNAEESAGYAGEMHDGGARVMRLEADAYEAGLKQEVPAFLKGHYDTIIKEQDPEYKEYLRLNAKFNKS